MNVKEVIEKFEINPSYKSYNSDRLSAMFNCSVETVKEAREYNKSKKKEDYKEYIDASGIQEKKENVEKGESEVKFLHTREVLSNDQIWDECKMDRNKWNFVQIYHKKYGRGFLYTANFRKKEVNSIEVFKDSFQDFLKTYKPSNSTIQLPRTDTYTNGVTLILPKQDAHFNKLDIYGDNDIDRRFSKNHDSVLKMLNKVQATSYLKEVVYIVGSDQFNSEWTSLTTKGTPQTNILSYTAAFQKICDHEVKVINTLIARSQQVKVVFLPGNHDQYVGWHLINWLECYYRGSNIKFNTSTENTKYHQFGNSAIMFNHGDAIKPRDMAQKFPMNFKENWSECKNFYIFTGDKHHEMSLDIEGIKFYQVPQLSSATSSWDDKMGFTTSKAEVTAFVISEDNGMTDILKDLI